jgi:histone H3/H4
VKSASSKTKSSGKHKVKSHSKSRPKSKSKERSKSKSTAPKKSRDSSAAPKRPHAVPKVKEASAVIEPVISARNETVVMNFPVYTGDDEKLKDRIKTDMRRAPFRALMKSMITEEQKKCPSLKGADIRMKREVPKASQLELENWGKDQFQLCTIAARHAGRNTINDEDIELVKCFDKYASGDIIFLRDMKHKRALAANQRMEDRKKMKTDKDGKLKEKKTADVTTPAPIVA